MDTTRDSSSPETPDQRRLRLTFAASDADMKWVRDLDAGSDPNGAELRLIRVTPGGPLIPGFLLPPSSWNEPGLMRKAVEEAVEALRRNPKRRHKHLHVIAQAVDFTTARGLPLPKFLREAVAVALGIFAVVERGRQTLTAIKMSRQRGTDDADIARELEVSTKTALRRLEASPPTPRNWSRPDEVVAAVRDGSDELLYDAIVWFAERGDPLPWPILLKLVEALGLKHPDGGLTEAARVSTWGVQEWEARQKAAKRVAEAHLQGEKKPSISELARVAEVSPPTIKRWMADRPRWQWACTIQEIWLRLRRSTESDLGSLS